MVHGVPTMHQAVLGGPPEINRSSRIVAFASYGPLRPPASTGHARTGRNFWGSVIESYGMTEAAHQMASNPLPPAQRKPGSVGLAAGPEVEIMARGDLLGPEEV
ncbi:MAG: hypothetical protein CM1200mP4_0680 [Rhodospirillaceae bacterium]|nr:MAG: hypothetical protein CM1200mP4_0680 [Rhodospirillaceae bacterium]